MKLSIITINYNDATGLEKTIQSVINQTYNNFQYIIIDGDSSDGSKNILHKYSHNIDIIISEPDNGIYNAMNKGASHANGEYLLFLNSGDELFNLEVLENIFKNQFHEQIVSGQLYCYSEKEAHLQTPPTNLSLYSFVGASLPHPSSLIKNELFKKIGGYHEEYRIISDWCFFVEATIKYNCTYKTLPMIIARFNQYGISTTSGNKEKEAEKIFLSEHFRRIIEDYLPIEDEALTNCSYWIASQKGILKFILMLPFKILNRLLKLRNKLKKRIGTNPSYIRF